MGEHTGVYIYNYQQNLVMSVQIAQIIRQKVFRFEINNYVAA
jgi:hypothetical protein